MKILKCTLLNCLLILLAACEKDTLPVNFSPLLKTGEATDVYRMGATLSGSIQRSGNVVVKDCGILLSELQSMAEYEELKSSSNSDITSLSVQVQSLQPGKTYYYCAYGSSGYSIARGEIKTFITPESNAPVFGELYIVERDDKSFLVSANLLDEGGSELILCGFCWKEADTGSGNPTTKDHVINALPEDNKLSVQIRDLKADKDYLVCAYGVNSKGIGYGKTMKVTTRLATVPTLSTITAKNSTELTITVVSRILSKGESDVTEVGFCWSSETQEPTKLHLYQALPEQLEQTEFCMQIDGLKPETTYYIRAYAVNSKGIGYGETYKFTTHKGKVLSITGMQTTGTMVTIYASMTGDLNTEACYYQLSQDRNNMEQSIGSLLTILPKDSDGIFGWKIGGLQPNTTYYARACYSDETIGRVESEIMELNTQQPGIYTLEDLVAFRDGVYAEKIKYVGENATVNLYADIDLSSIENWIPIEVFAAWSDVRILEGNGHSILGLRMKHDKEEEWRGKGLINKNQGIVRNLHITGEIVIEDFETDISYCGAVCGLNVGVISGCTSNVKIDARKVKSNVFVGGVCGNNGNDGKVIDCINKGVIAGGRAHIGGVVGNNYSGTVENCVNYGAISSESSCAGITRCFTASAKVLNCTNYGEIRGGNSQTGGICSIMNYATMDACNNYGTVIGKGDVGGVVGLLANKALLLNCINGGNVTGDPSLSSTGGICGWLENGCTYSNNKNGGTINGIPGTEVNAIGIDGRRVEVGEGDIDDLPTHEWE